MKGRTMTVGMRRSGIVAAIVLLIASVGMAAPPKVGETAKDFELKSIGGAPVKLGEMTKAGPVVLIVLRGYPGYQCPLCTRQMAELVGKKAEFAKRKAHVVLVYPGPAGGLKEKAGEFLGGKGLPEGFSLVTDPDFVFLKSYDLRWDAPGETSYPSTFVIDEQGKIRFAKTSKSHGDRARTADVLKALDDAKG